MNTKYCSLYLCLQFLPSMSYNFHYPSFSPLIKFIILLFFGAILNGVVFLISLSDNLLLVYGNSTDFCMSSLYSTILLTYFILTDFLVALLLISSLTHWLFRSVLFNFHIFVKSSVFLLWLTLVSYYYEFGKDILGMTSVYLTLLRPVCDLIYDLFWRRFGNIAWENVYSVLLHRM